MMSLRVRRGWLVLAFLLWLGGAVWASGAAAADTGGRMGGGNWSSPSSSSSSSSRSSGGGSYSSGRSSGGSYSSGRSSGGGGSISPGLLLLMMLGVGAIVVFQAMMKSQGQGGSMSHYANIGYTPGYAADVSVLRVAIDGRARKLIQSELARIAQSADTATDEGRLHMLREVSLLLRRVRDAWVYGGAVNEPMMSLGNAKVAFDKHVDDARARFKKETFSNVQGQQRQLPAGELSPRSDEGAGLILITLVVAARSELFTVSQIGDGEHLRQALDAVSNRVASDLVAIEVIWQPAEEQDRLSSMELEAKYPRPQLIPISGALVGKVFCAYCGGPFPGELVSCPHCGAPARDDQPAPRAA